MCRAWLSIHSPQYSSRRSASSRPSRVTPQAASIARHALSWYATGQIPQIRAVMSGGSVWARPRRNASKNRGGS